MDVSAKKNLFADVDPTKPATNPATEIAALKERVAELEALLREKNEANLSPFRFEKASSKPNQEVWQRESDEQVRFALEAAGIGTWEWNVIKNEVKWSANMAGIFGLTNGATPQTYDEYLDLIHPGDRQDFVQAVRQAIKDKENFEVQFRVIRAGGAYHWNIGKGKIITGDNGQPLRLLGVIYDINDFKHTTEALRFLVDASHTLTSSLDYETNLQQLAALAVPRFADWCMVFVQETDGEIKQVAVRHSDPARTAWALEFQSHYPYNTRIGRSLLKEIIQVAQTGQPQYLPEMPDGLLKGVAIDPVHLEWMRELGPRSKIAVPLVARNRIFGVISFITSHESGRNYTLADFELAQELARQVGQAIDNSWLYRQAQESIEIQRQLDRLKDQFLSIASHELRTPLTTIKGYSQILQRDLLRLRTGNQPVLDQSTSRSVRILSNLVGQVGRMEILINEMLDISRIQSGQFHLKLTGGIILNEVVRRIVEQQQDADPDRPILFQPNTFELEGMWDENRLEQVINNLISNAIKYSEPGKPVEVGVGYATITNEAVVWVRDEGIGISAEHQNQIFDRFYRVRTPMNVSVDGLGLGLYISFETIKQHGGHMWLESAPGEGSTFYFSLPLPDEARPGGTEVAP
ncbi:MAG: PAS domain-containing protein [Chloroflexi bacterium]|nr:PAS domain-containing protein [Chloroflexota bacterium]OJV97160.1 MAG: hypothetical protein BGO39_19455 [Chloroflexi bacterium 54-19]